MKHIDKLNYDMLRIRMIEEEIASRYGEGKMRCPVHLSVGQEAAAVGVCAALRENDKMVSTHRGHAHYLARGGSLKGLLGELYGKFTGCSKGNGGSMHLTDMGVGFYGSTSIVAGTVPVGVGIAFANKIKWDQNDDQVVVVFIGDAAVEEGIFHEAANFASLHELRVIFVCENNQYSCYTHISKRQPDRNGHSLREIAIAHNLAYKLTRPNNVHEIKQMTTECISLSHYGPSFIEIPTFRYLQHCGPDNDDNLGYRSEGEIKKWHMLDPIVAHEVGWRDEIKAEINEAFRAAEAADFPDEDEIGKYVYASNT